MGKGDKKSKRGKLFKGSYGVRRRKNAVKSASVALPINSKPKESNEIAEVKKAVKEVKEVKAKVVKEAAPAKAPKAAPAVKKSPKPKKQETAE